MCWPTLAVEFDITRYEGLRIDDPCTSCARAFLGNESKSRVPSRNLPKQATFGIEKILRNHMESRC